MNPEKSDATLLQEAALSEIARRSLINFTCATHHHYLDGWFSHELAGKLDQFLDDCIHRRSPRLMIMSAPRSGKSELVSRRFPAYALGKYPDESIISTSYSSDLAGRMSRDVGRIMDEEKYHRIFPQARIAQRDRGQETRTSELFEMVGRRGSYRAAGVGQGITGLGATLFGLIDDPLKDAAEAGSPAVRESIYEWYRSVLYTRLEPGAGMLIVATRWNLLDLLGQLLLDMRDNHGDRFDVVRYPAIAIQDEEHRKEGDALDPDRWPLEALHRIKKTIGNYAFSSLYQQEPIPRTGSVFNPERMEVLEQLPAPIKGSVRSWDRAATEGAGDYTVGVLIAELEDNPVAQYAILDVVRGQWGSDRREAVTIQTAQSDGYEVPIVLEQEPGSGGKDSVHATTILLSGWQVTTVRATGKKEARADAFSAQVNAGNVCVLNRPWTRDLLEEFRGFPSATPHDDIVDACAQGFNAIARQLVSWEDLDSWLFGDTPSPDEEWAA